MVYQTSPSIFTKRTLYLFYKLYKYRFMIYGRTLRCRDPNPGMLFAAEFCIWVLGVTRDDTILIFGGGTLPAGCNENFFLPPIWVNSWRFTFSTSSKNDTLKALYQLLWGYNRLYIPFLLGYFTHL